MVLGTDGGGSPAPAPKQVVRQTISNASPAEETITRNTATTNPSQRTLALWTEVAHGIDKPHQTVVWKNAVDSLSDASRYFLTFGEARRFVDNYMKPVISILLEQQPSKIGLMEKACVDDSLRWAVQIVYEDLKAKNDPANGECILLEVLSMIFNRKRIFYKGSKQTWNVNASGMPEVRMHMINKFRNLRGFDILARYLAPRVSTSQFPPLDWTHCLLQATCDSIPAPNHSITPETIAKVKMFEEDAVLVARAVMTFMGTASEDLLKKLPHESLSTVRTDLQRIFDRLAPSRRKDTMAFYEFWREFALKLITSQSLPLKLFGWETVTDLIDASVDMRPPHKSFIVSGAGCTLVNGRYNFAGLTTDDGYFWPGSDIRYELHIPDAKDIEGAEKKLTLFRCTMRSQQKWWFLSEADEDQPGTDKDVDYYQHKSKHHEESEPPASGWVTCKNSGTEPPPTLVASGLVVPPGEEYNTMEHQLAQWALNNHIVELVLGDSIHREIVARSIPLIKFLASMCDKDEPIKDAPPTMVPNVYCLKAVHLKLAWKTCTSKADAAVSAEVYQLLVSILPSLPNDLAIQLLASIQESLLDAGDKRDYVFEVAEFCSALSTMNSSDTVAGNNNTNNAAIISPALSDNVRAAILRLFWAILTHPDASTLKGYEQLKSYVVNELRVEPMGALHRESFLKSCKLTLNANAKISKATASGDVVDELLALRMVKLTKFVLEACPLEQAVVQVTDGKLALTSLLFNELVAYLNRRAGVGPGQMARRLSLPMGPADNSLHVTALSDRLNIIRYAYGLTNEAEMTCSQLDHLWTLCTDPFDREALMVFLANASNNEAATSSTTGVLSIVDDSPTQQHTHPGTANTKQPLLAAYSDEVRVYAFQNLFCCSSVDWERLGLGAYQSFQILFKSLRKAVRTSLTSNGPALDALWRICLAAGNDDVASQAMRDLLAVYSAMAATNRQSNISNAWNSHLTVALTEKPEESFARRVFQCLFEVKKGLEAGEFSSERSAERCVRILNAAVGHNNGSGKSTPLSVSPSIMASIATSTTVSGALHAVPHGMRGQACYRTIGVLAKLTASQNNATGSIAPLAEGSNAGFSLSNQQTSFAKLPSVVRFSLQVHPLESLSSIKAKVAQHCNHQVAMVKPLSVSGRQPKFVGKSSGSDSAQMSLNVVSDDSLVADLGITDGCEVVFLLASHFLPASTASSMEKITSKRSGLELSEIFAGDDAAGLAERFFDTLLAVLEALPVKACYSTLLTLDTHGLVWDYLLSIPTNAGIINRVRSAASHNINVGSSSKNNVDSMAVDTPRRDEQWSTLLDNAYFHRSVYVMQVIDFFLQPAEEILFNIGGDRGKELRVAMRQDAVLFRQRFIDSGGFSSVLRFFTKTGRQDVSKPQNTRMGNAFALRIIKCCFFGSDVNVFVSPGSTPLPSALDFAGNTLLKSLSDPKELIASLTLVVVADGGVSDAAILDTLYLLRLLFLSHPVMTEHFATLPDGMAEKFMTTLLLWESNGAVNTTSVNAGFRIRRSTQELILMIPTLSYCALPWLIKALNGIDVASDGSTEFFAVLISLVEGACETEAGNMETCISSRPSLAQLRDLSTAICKKFASNPRPTSDAAITDSTGVLCGCLKLLKALVENGEGGALIEGVELLLFTTKSPRWSKIHCLKNSAEMFDVLVAPSNVTREDAALIDLMGAIFDGFLSSADLLSATAVCCEKDSRQLAFDAVAAAAHACKGGDGYLALSSRINSIITASTPSLRHCWGQKIGFVERESPRASSGTSRYSGLRNQGCTCYMNSVLQQLFMMPELRKAICSATIPTNLRSSGHIKTLIGAELVGKHISVQWDSGLSYDAIVENYDASTGMHIVRYCPLQIAAVGGPHGAGTSVIGHHHTSQLHPGDLAALPDEMPDEFMLSEGRPGKETGVFEIMLSSGSEVSGNGRVLAGESSQEDSLTGSVASSAIQETEEEASARRLLEEVQRTFVHLDEGVRGRCFDLRSLVEASGCLKLEFDVWQQNDASEFAMKLLDRIEVPLKRWSPVHFKYLEHTFCLKQTKQKICKECGLKTNREENLMNIDCQIRGKVDIHEALSTMCEVEFMEGDNKVFCDRCKKKCDTVLRTAISALPDMLILSLKRFDLDYNTFETVKLNSRCAFGQTLNMKRYTLEGVEATEKNSFETDSIMDTDEVDADLRSSHSDEDYEYKLAGVLVHAGVAQGGHYYSFIKDRSFENTDDVDRWYRFDDEDVTPFDPSSIEVECFGGKVKKETKWPNGQVQTVESEQFANALMLFYEKVVPAKFDHNEDIDDGAKDFTMEELNGLTKVTTELSSGYDVFQADVRKSNTTLSWHTFLFDPQFQSFLSGMLQICFHQTETTNDIENMDTATSVLSSAQSSLKHDMSPSWRLVLLKLSLTFFFDVLLHSAHRDILQGWAHKLSAVLGHFKAGAKFFVYDLARRTNAVAANWLRTYCADCPEDVSRSAGVQVIAAGIQACCSFQNELSALHQWTQAWVSQLCERERVIAGLEQNTGPVPTKLEGEWQKHEDVSAFDSGVSSALGVLISYLANLIEVAPRTWRSNPELCMLLREVGSLSKDAGGDNVRLALIESQMPARLVCLFIRERAPPMLRASFPGASVSVDIAAAMAKSETRTSSHMMPLAGSSVGMSSSGGGNVTMPTAADHVVLLEALASIIGIRGLNRATLVYETGEIVKNRLQIALSRTAGDALAAIFHECMSSSMQGMSQGDIQNYMRLCGVDASAVPPQRIANILTKYQTVSAVVGGKESRFLTLEGFLAYYRDTAQSNEFQVRSDLYTFGFRPNLSRRPEDARFYTVGDRKHFFQRSESVAIDVVLSLENAKRYTLGHLADIGLMSLHFYSLAYCACENLAEYILAWNAYGRDTARILPDALKVFSRAPSGWAGSEICQASLMVFKILAAIQDDRQPERICTMMQSMEKLHPHADAGVGLLVAAKELSSTRTSQHYSVDYHNTGSFDRYADALKELQKQREVAKWMSENRAAWSWMEQWLRNDIVPAPQHQERGEYSNRREGGLVVPPTATITLHHHSDSDMNNGINDSDEDDDDDDSRFDQVYTFNDGRVIISGAGIKSVNGTYTRNGLFDNVGKYCKPGVWKQKDDVFSLFRCRLSNSTRRWYISIVPKGIQPGTNKDIDFYSAPVSVEHGEYPPETNWTTAKDHGVDPPPTLVWKPDIVPDGDDDPTEDGERMWNGDSNDIDEAGEEQMGYL